MKMEERRTEMSRKRMKNSNEGKNEEENKIKSIKQLTRLIYRRNAREFKKAESENPLRSFIVSIQSARFLPHLNCYNFEK